MAKNYWQLNSGTNGHFSPQVLPAVFHSCPGAQTLSPQWPGAWLTETLPILQTVTLQRAPSPQRGAWHIPTVDDHLDCPLPLYSDAIICEDTTINNMMMDLDSRQSGILHNSGNMPSWCKTKSINIL